MGGPRLMPAAGLEAGDGGRLTDSSGRMREFTSKGRNLGGLVVVGSASVLHSEIPLSFS